MNDVTAHRGRLLAIAYRLLGSAVDAEDAVQEAFVRWQRADTEDVAEPVAWLTTAVSRICLDMLGSARARRERYVGPWLPEPVVTAADPAAEVELAESVRMALLVVLESLSPAERAAFVLHDVFGHSYAEVAAALGRSEAACRQLGARARRHVSARSPRYGADPAQRRQVTDRFVAACSSGDVSSLLAVLAPDVVLTSDGGGLVSAARRPVAGADRVARLLLGLLGRAPEGSSVVLLQLNGDPGLVVTVAGLPRAALVIEVTAAAVSAVRIVVNPDKLAGLTPELPTEGMRPLRAEG